MEGGDHLARISKGKVLHMAAVKVTKDYFASSSRLFGADGLGAVIRGLAIDNARAKIMASDIEDLTDNSTGTSALAGVGIVDLVIPTVAFDATSAGGSPRAALNTAIGVLENALAVLAEAMNTARAKLGLTAYTYAGTVAVANTIPAITKALTATSGTSAVDFVSGRAKLIQAKQHLRKVVHGMDEVFVAVGADPLVSALTGEYSGVALSAIADADAAATGASSISDAVADAFLLAFANNVATIAAKWNAVMVQGSDTQALQVVAG